jgi:hypothetical protein
MKPTMANAIIRTAFAINLFIVNPVVSGFGCSNMMTPDGTRNAIRKMAIIRILEFGLSKPWLLIAYGARKITTGMIRYDPTLVI